MKAHKVNGWKSSTDVRENKVFIEVDIIHKQTIRLMLVSNIKWETDDYFGEYVNEVEAKVS